MAFQAGDIVSHLTLDTNKYIASLNAAAVEARRFAAENATAAERGAAAWAMFGTVGMGLTAGVTTPIVGGFAAAAKGAIAFESAFAGVRKTVNASEVEYAALNRQLLEMSRIVPRSAESLAGIMEAGGQLGVPQAQLEKFTRTIADLSVATNLTEEAGASMLAQYANVMRMDLGNIDRLGSVIVDLGNNTATTEADIVSMAQRLSGAGSILNLTNAQVMGLAATMASLGINAEAGGSAASRVLQRMMRDVRAGGEELKLYAKTANMSAEAFSSAFGDNPLSALVSFIDGLAQVNEAGGDVYGILEDLNLSDIRITDTLLRLAGGQGLLEKNIKRANAAWEENNALTKEAEQRYNTTESKIQLAKNSINAAGISIGNAFLPVIGRAAEGVADLANRFADLDEGQQKNIITQAGVAAAIGPVMMLVKGVAGVLGGPGGLVVAAGLGAAAIAAINTAAKEATFKGMADEFGNIKLDAQEIQDIIKVGFGAPAIDTSKLNTARDDAEQARAKFAELQAQLEKDVYLVRMGVQSLTAEQIDAQVGAVVGAANEYLQKEENAARMTIKAYFGEGSTEAGSMLSGLDQHMATLKSEMAAKGKELGDALKGAIADGKIDAEEEKIIANLQNELEEISTRGAMMKSQADRDLLIANARRNGLTVDSIRSGNKGMLEYADTLRADLENEREMMIRIASNLKTGGALTESEYQARLSDIERRYGNLGADVDMSMLDTMYEMYGRQLSDVFSPKLQEVQSLLNVPGFDYYGYDAEGNPARETINTAKREAEVWMREMQPIMTVLQNMRERMGGEMPQKYQAMLDFFTEMQALAEMDIEALKKEKPTTTQDIDDGAALDEAKRKKKQEGKELAQARAEGEAEGARETAQGVAEAYETNIEGAKENRDKIFGSIVDLGDEARDKGRESGAEAVQSVNEGAASQEVTVDESIMQPLEKLPEEAGAIGGQIGRELGSGARAQGAYVYRSGQYLGGRMEAGIKKSLGIASPSKVITGIIHNIRDTAINITKSIGPAIEKAFNWLGGVQADSYQSGYQEQVEKGREYRPLDPNAAANQPIIDAGVVDARGANAIPRNNTSNKSPLGSGGGGRSAETVKPDYSAGVNATLARVTEEENRLRAALDSYDAQSERLLSLTASWRPYYDKTELDRQVAAINEKYKALMDAETAGYEALGEAERQARSQAHNRLMQQLQQNQRDEVSALQSNYRLQQQLGADFLSSTSNALSAAFAARQEAARTEDYQNSVAELEKRIRQSRSARERRELTEQLDRMRRDEGLRQEQQTLNETLQGIQAMQKALSAGVIGLGDLLSDPSLQRGTGGLGAVQGITAEQLESVLDAVADRQAQGGHQYSIDLSGAVIRDESDIDRIIDGFEERMRSIQRDMWR